MTDNDIIKAFDILCKIDFFGQRAGRELWNEKPVDIQNQDIENHSKDIAFLKDFFNRQQAEIKTLREIRDLCNNTILEQNELIKKLEISDASKEKCTIEQHGEIKELRAEIEDLSYKLDGVMHSVDKWLDDNELKQDEVNRALTMREKTLQITEKQQAEIDSLNKKIKQIHKNYFAIVKDGKVGGYAQLDIKRIKAEAVKEFAEKVKVEIKEALESNYKARAEKEKKEFNKYLDNLFWNYCTGKIDCLRGIDDFIDNLLKEKVGDEHSIACETTNKICKNCINYYNDKCIKENKNV